MIHLLTIAMICLAVMLGMVLLFAILALGVLIFGAGRIYKAHGTDYDERTMKDDQ